MLADCGGLQGPSDAHLMGADRVGKTEDRVGKARIESGKMDRTELGKSQRHLGVELGKMTGSTWEKAYSSHTTFRIRS